MKITKIKVNKSFSFHDQELIETKLYDVPVFENSFQ